MSLSTAVFFVTGIAALVVGAEALVRGAARLAARTGLSPVVIGLTVVAFGTSAPELAVSLGAAFRDEADLAIGNVVGSNIANVLLVLGLAAVAGGGLVVAQRIVRIDVPIMVGVVDPGADVRARQQHRSLGGCSSASALLIVYVSWTVISTRPIDQGQVDRRVRRGARAPNGCARVRPWSTSVRGRRLVAAGRRLDGLVEAATDIATDLGVSDLVIGLTVVAIGTSLPEVATSVLAAMPAVNATSRSATRSGRTCSTCSPCSASPPPCRRRRSRSPTRALAVDLPGHDRRGVRLPADLRQRIFVAALGGRAVPRRTTPPI